MKFVIVAAALLAAALTIEPASAFKVPDCKGGGPPDAKSAAAAFSYYVKGNGACGAASDIDGCALFGNAEKRLPRAGKGEDYYEARVGEDRFGGAGKRRLVFLITGTYRSRDALIVAKYFTPDHYETFCRMD